MTLSLIVAMADNGVIGREGRLPWHLSADLKRFKHLTMGHAIVMGRRTYESIGRPLPGRRSIVVSRNAAFRPAGVEVADSLDKALRLAAGDDEIFVIGGASLYREALARAERLYVTRVHAAVPGDTFFPPFDPADWRLEEQTVTQQDAASQLGYSFERYARAAPAA
jgi:dihydrofolate reductase